MDSVLSGSMSTVGILQRLGPTVVTVGYGVNRDVVTVGEPAPFLDLEMQMRRVPGDRPRSASWVHDLPHLTTAAPKGKSVGQSPR